MQLPCLAGRWGRGTGHAVIVDVQQVHVCRDRTPLLGSADQPGPALLLEGLQNMLQNQTSRTCRIEAASSLRLLQGCPSSPPVTEADFPAVILQPSSVWHCRREWAIRLAAGCEHVLHGLQGDRIAS